MKRRAEFQLEPDSDGLPQYSEECFSAEDENKEKERIQYKAKRPSVLSENTILSQSPDQQTKGQTKSDINPFAVALLKHKLELKPCIISSGSKSNPFAISSTLPNPFLSKPTEHSKQIEDKSEKLILKSLNFESMIGEITQEKTEELLRSLVAEETITPRKILPCNDLKYERKLSVECKLKIREKSRGNGF